MSIIAKCPRCGNPIHNGPCFHERSEVVQALDSRDAEIALLREQLAAGRPITPAEEAVIAAAKEWVEQYGHGGPSKPGVTGDLIKAVRALSPQAVRPEEVEPGTLFTFAAIGPGRFAGDTREYKVVRRYASDPKSLAFMYPGGNEVFTFQDTDRIIPLPDQEEE